MSIPEAVVAAARPRAGYPCEDERFHPHVTLGRFKPDRRGPCDLTAVVERYRSWSCGDFTAFEVVGFASRLWTSGAELRGPQPGSPRGREIRAFALT